MATSPLVLGIESCASHPPAVLQGKPLGLLMNRASVDVRLNLACDVINRVFPGQLRSIFTPQHGLWGDAQANMVETPSSLHEQMQIPVHSLYSATRRPTPDMLSEVEYLLVDLQDVGTRVYTFIWTLLECMKACKELGITVVILDRPNPLGGRVVEGPVLNPDCISFVGGSCIPMRHGLTIGEIARFLNQEHAIGVELLVVPIEGWRTDMSFEEWKRPWMLPSPNLPTIESTRVYPGQVMLEGTNISEGRGTTTPFEVFGAPFVDPYQLTERLNRLELDGVRFLPVVFQPAFDKWAGQSCGGSSMHVTDARRFRPFRTTIELLTQLSASEPEDFQWLQPPYEYETVKQPIDIIYGNAHLREGSRGPEELSCVDVSSWACRTIDAQLYDRCESRFVA